MIKNQSAGNSVIGEDGQIGLKMELGFWAENGGVAIDYFRLTIEYWAKIKGGVEKKDEKLQKKLQNDKEKRKKRKK